MSNLMSRLNARERLYKLYIACCIYCFFTLHAPAQGVSTAAPVTASSPIILTDFQQKALLAFAPSSAKLSRLTLSGTVTHILGKTRESGSVELTSGVDGYVSERWNVTGANRVVLKTAFGDGRECTVSVNGGAARPAEGVDCLQQVPWFAPWLGVPLLQSGVGSATEKVGEAGTTVLTFAPMLDSSALLNSREKAQTDHVLQVSQAQVLFDSVTALPSGLRFQQPLSTDTSNAIDVTVVFSEYRLDQGYVLPHRIQRYIQRTLESDIQISNVVLN